MYDDEYDEDEEESAGDAEDLRSEEFNTQRGKDDRAFYDDLAKKEDERHNAMRADIKKRSLVLGELEQKLRHKKTELRTLEMKIAEEKNAIDAAEKKVYRTTVGVSDGDERVQAEVIPILSRDIGKESSTDEFSVSRALANIKQLEAEKAALESVISEMAVTVSEEERALSQLQHTLLRM